MKYALITFYILKLQINNLVYERSTNNSLQNVQFEFGVTYLCLVRKDNNVNIVTNKLFCLIQFQICGSYFKLKLDRNNIPWACYELSPIMQCIKTPH